MAKKAKKKGDSKREKSGYKAGLKWVLNNLSDVLLEDLDRRQPSDAQILEFLMACVDNGIDVKITHDSFSETYTAIAVGAWVDFSSEGYATSGRSARDTTDALSILWYKVVVLADGDLSSVPTEKDIDNMRG